MGIGHRAQSESIYYRKILFFSLFLYCWKDFFFLMLIFIVQHLGRKKRHYRFQELRGGLPLLPQIQNEKGNIFHSCYLQIWQMSFQLFRSLSTVWYAPVNAVLSGITVSIIKRPEGSLMNSRCVGLEGYRKKSLWLQHATFLEMINNPEHIRVQETQQK